MNRPAKQIRQAALCQTRADEQRKDTVILPTGRPVADATDRQLVLLKAFSNSHGVPPGQAEVGMQRWREGYWLDSMLNCL